MVSGWLKELQPKEAEEHEENSKKGKRYPSVKVALEEGGVKQNYFLRLKRSSKTKHYPIGQLWDLVSGAV